MAHLQLDFESQLSFTKYNERYKTEKPYAFKIPLEGADIPSSNIDHSGVGTAHITDIRGVESSFSLSKNGFAIFHVEDDLSYEDYHDEIKVQKYFREVEALLKNHLKAKDVKVFRHAVRTSQANITFVVLNTLHIRKRSAAWPEKYKGEVYSYDQPTTVAHIDCTPREVYQEVRRHHSENFDELSKTQIQWINFWKPLKGPLNDWPLIFCDSSTVNRDKDLEPADLIYPDRVAENTCIYHNPDYKWYYLSSQETSEIIVFVQGDTLVNALPGVPHCSVRNPRAPPNETPRESIEVRCLVFFD